MVGFTANKIEVALHKCSTQLMMSHTVTDLCTTIYLFIYLSFTFHGSF